MFCATVLYSNKQGSTFDFEHYANILAPMYAKFLGDNCVKFEVRKGLGRPSGADPQYICIASFRINSREKYGKLLSEPGIQDLMTKISSFTDIEPLRQLDSVIG